MALHAGERRKHLRFKQDPGEMKDLEKKALSIVAHIDVGENEEFHPRLMGYVVEESHAGCSLVVLRSKSKQEDALQEGTHCVLKVGVLHPLPAVVRWRKELDDDLLKLGFQFNE